jgi:hypothetical protein
MGKQSFLMILDRVAVAAFTRATFPINQTAGTEFSDYRHFTGTTPQRSFHQFACVFANMLQHYTSTSCESGYASHKTRSFFIT